MSRPIVAILGCGRVSQSMAGLLHRAELRLWGRHPPATLHDFAGATFCDTIAAACHDADAVVFTVPVSAVRDVAREYGEVARGEQVVLMTARGVAEGFVLPHAIVRQETCVRKIGVVTALQAGPPAAVVVASLFADPATLLRQLVEEIPAFVYPTRDVVGVQVAAAIGNVTAMAVGMADALELGDTVRGLLLTRGLGEASRLGQALGAQVSTFASLAGVGALIPRPRPHPDRHVELGELLGRGKSLAAAEAQVEGEADGVVTAREAVLLAGELHIEVPLMRAVQAVADGSAGPADALATVLHLGLDFGGLQTPRSEADETP